MTPTPCTQAVSSSGSPQPSRLPAGRPCLLSALGVPLLLAGLAVTAACDEEHAHGGAEITFASPLDGAVVAVDAVVDIVAHVEAEEPMHGWVVEVRDHADDTVLATFDAHDHMAMYHIEETWTAAVGSGTEVDIEVIVTVDHDGATTKQLITITVE